MDRRTFLAGTVGTASLGSAGCLGLFETRSAWEQPPLVEDRPDAVYRPAAIEQMQTFGVQSADGLQAGLFFTFPHRFWVVTGEEDSLVTIGDEDVLHLMASVWDPDTGLVPPAEILATVRRDGERVDDYQLWPMLSQRMGFHYGDNVALGEQGSYEIELRIDPTSARTTGAVDGAFDRGRSTTFEIEYRGEDVLGIDYEFVDEDRRGEPGAVPLMSERQVSDDGEAYDHPPSQQAPREADLPGQVYDLGRTGDARLFATVLDDGPVEGGSYLAVSPRSPYNRLSLPLMGLSVRVDRDGQPVVEERLLETLDDQLGHHYGGAVDLESGDEVTIRIDAPPQVSRHDGYETAFFGIEDVSFEYRA